jgi:hypothetical protein
MSNTHFSPSTTCQQVDHGQLNEEGLSAKLQGVGGLGNSARGEIDRETFNKGDI